MIANSPAFRSGKKPLGACAMKYATAMSPARMNATGRVNKPSTISTPPTSSIMPLMPERDIGATPVEGETGKLKYFDIPCSRNSRPTMMRKILRTRGDHVARKLSIAGIIIPPVDALRSWHTIRDHGLSDVNISGLANGALGEHRRHDTDGMRLEIVAPGCWSSVRKSTEPTCPHVGHCGARPNEGSSRGFQVAQHKTRSADLVNAGAQLVRSGAGLRPDPYLIEHVRPAI